MTHCTPIFPCLSLGFADCNDVLPVYIDDDRTDEDPFKVLISSSAATRLISTIC
jgi:hypothetical protein